MHGRDAVRRGGRAIVEGRRGERGRGQSAGLAGHRRHVRVADRRSRAVGAIAAGARRGRL